VLVRIGQGSIPGSAGCPDRSRIGLCGWPLSHAIVGCNSEHSGKDCTIGWSNKEVRKENQHR